MSRMYKIYIYIEPNHFSLSYSSSVNHTLPLALVYTIVLFLSILS